MSLRKRRRSSHGESNAPKMMPMPSGNIAPRGTRELRALNIASFARMMLASPVRSIQMPCAPQRSTGVPRMVKLDIWVLHSGHIGPVRAGAGIKR